MKMTDVFVIRPVLSLSISFLLIILGTYTLTQLPFREYPKMTNTVITVTTAYYGADANLIQSFITQPIEQAIAQADNIDYISSSSAMGMSTIEVYMKLNTSPDAALADILSKVNSVRSQLPVGVQDPSITSSTGQTTALAYVSFTSHDLTSSQITDFLSRIVQPQLLMVQGVAQATIYSSGDFAVRVWLDPYKMAAYELSASEVISILRDNNLQSTSGKIDNYFTYLNVEAQTQMKDVSNLGNLIVKSTNSGSTVRLSDIALISLDAGRDTFRAHANGKQAVIIGIDPTPSANPLSVMKRVNEQWPSIEKTLPSSISMNLVYDSTQAINISIQDVIKTILEAVIVVIITIALFIGSLRAVFIPVITIPLSLIGVTILMYIFDFSLNLLTLLAMILSIGLVVDDAIVVVENIDRHMQKGLSRFKASILGTREIAIPVISMTLTLVAVYSPVALLGGITGALFKEFALTLAGAVCISGIVALTLSPMLCSQILKSSHEQNKFEKKISQSFEKLSVLYEKSLLAMMEHRKVVVLFALLTFCSLPILFKFIPRELAPVEDYASFMLFGNATESANIDYVQAGMQEASAALMKIPEIKTVITFSGFPASNQGISVAKLALWGDRDKSQKKIIEEANEVLTENTTMAVTGFPFPSLPGGSRGMPVQFVITSPSSFIDLYDIAQKVETMIKNSSFFIVSRMDLDFSSGTLSININRDKLGAYGVTMRQVADTLSTLIGNNNVNRMNLDGRAYEVIPQVMRKDRLIPEAIADYYVKSSTGKMISLRNFVDLRVTGQPKSLSHFNQVNSVTISMVPMPGNTIGASVDFLKQNAVPLLPKGYQYSFLGEARQYATESHTLTIIFMIALLFIFFVLASQFESLRDPLVILISVPLAISGSLVFMAWGFSTLNIYTQIGLVTLIGLISKHGILICEVAKNQQIEHSMDRTKAVIYASKLRLRAILMTTISMLTGLLPLLIARGPGAVSRFDIGLVIITGLGIGTLFTLFVLPVIYSYIASKHKPLKSVNEC